MKIYTCRYQIRGYTCIRLHIAFDISAEYCFLVYNRIDLNGNGAHLVPAMPSTQTNKQINNKNSRVKISAALNDIRSPKSAWDIYRIHFFYCAPSPQHRHHFIVALNASIFCTLTRVINSNFICTRWFDGRSLLVLTFQRSMWCKFASEMATVFIELTRYCRNLFEFIKI